VIRALCVAIGIAVRNIPILGVSTILCTVIALHQRRFPLAVPQIGRSLGLNGTPIV